MASTADSSAAIKTEHCAYQSIHLTDNQIRKEFCENDYRRVGNAVLTRLIVGITFRHLTNAKALTRQITSVNQ